MVRSLLLFGIASALLGGTAYAGPATAASMPTLTAIDGKTYQPLDVTNHKAAVLVFILQDCPICNGYAPLVRRLAARFGPAGVRFYIVHVDPSLSVADARKHASDYGYTLPVLIDRKHELVTALHVGVAPTSIVLGQDGAVKYEGRIDDQYAGIGKPRTVATTHELQDAIASVIDGKPVAVSKTRTIGCAVPDLPSKSDKP
jgi:peroxiredoxin